MSGSESRKKYAKELYEWRKAHGICICCGKADAEPGKTLCLVCRMDRREYWREYHRKKAESITEEEKQIRNEKSLRRYYERKEQGLCTQCSKPRYKNFAHCYDHYLSHKRSCERSSRKKYSYHPSGTCRICGGEPAPGHKMCQIHYKEYSERMTKLNKERKGRGE